MLLKRQSRLLDLSSSKSSKAAKEFISEPYSADEKHEKEEVVNVKWFCDTRILLILAATTIAIFAVLARILKDQYIDYF